MQKSRTTEFLTTIPCTFVLRHKFTMNLPFGKGRLELNGNLHAPLPSSKCCTVADLENTLTHLLEEENAIVCRLNDLLSMQEDLNRSLSRLDLLRAHLGTQVVAARSLSNEMLSPTASTASRVSSAVKALDIEQARIKATLEVVEKVVELKACVLGVTGSMGAPQDWETAAAYLHRAGKIPKEIIEGEFAEEMVPTAEVPDLPKVTLHNAAESLCGLFLREFERAAATQPPDGEKITRFFKLFPLIGRAEVGLDIYGKYVCTGISSRARAALAEGTGAGVGGTFFYANAITRLFEHIAGIVEQHSPLVERHYGKGKMGRVITRVQREVDLQGGIILDTWADERQVDRKITETKSYAFTFLVQAFLPNSRSPAALQRTGSPATGRGGGAIGASVAQGENEGADVKEIDMIVLEIGAMLSRWSLYCRFMARKVQETEEMPSDFEEYPALTIPLMISDSALSTKISARLLNPYLNLTTFFIRRTVEKAFQLDEPPSELFPLPLFNPNNPASTFQATGSPLITSAVDDVMYIVNKLLHRSLHTSSCHLVTGVLATVSRVLGSDYIGVIQRRMRDECNPRPTPQTTTIIVGNPAATLTQAVANLVDDRSCMFMVLINNLDISSEYCRRIVTSYLNASSQQSELAGTEIYGDDSAPPVPLEALFPFKDDPQQVRTALGSLESGFTQKCTEVLSDAVLTLFNQLVKAKLRPLITEAFRDMDYSITAPVNTTAANTDISEAEATFGGRSLVVPEDILSLQGEEVPKTRFDAAFSALIYPFKSILTEATFSKLLNHIANYLARLLEKKILQVGGGVMGGIAAGGGTIAGGVSSGGGGSGSSGLGTGGNISDLGAIRLERDVAGIIGVVVKFGRYGVRELFARCAQICLVLSADEEEAQELWRSHEDNDGGVGGDDPMGVEWKLSMDEKRRVRGMLIKR